jgi:uncharacterized radical SAM superfamily Fe-S cluster-containing enzyme
MSIQGVTPQEIFIRPDSIPRHRATRTKTHFQGCSQINQIFMKASGKITCSCMRYYHVLEDARNINVAEWFNGQMMTYIRESFKEGLSPFSFCEGCVCRNEKQDIDKSARHISLHIEPSSQCNLFCSACTCTSERQSSNAPARANLDFSVFEKMMHDLKGGTIPVASVAFVGFGEPLFNSRLPDMARLSRALFPQARIFVDTNCNFGTKRAAEMADCGLSDIRMGIDGSNQENYAVYRESGNFDKAFAFARTLAHEIRERGSSTKVLWKYILFRHNDSDDAVISAARMAREIGVDFQLDVTYGELASKRPLSEVTALLHNGRVGTNLDPANFRT